MTFGLTANRTHRLTAARVLIALVLVMNVQSAIAFLAAPNRYAPAYGLSGISGQAAMQGMAVLFLMWNVPYAVAAWNPIRFRVSYFEALAMQSIGVAGELAIYLSIRSGAVLSPLAASIQRFLAFDAAGLAILLGAGLAVLPFLRSPSRGAR